MRCSRLPVVLATVVCCSLLSPLPALAEAARWTAPLGGEPEVLRPFDPPEQRWLRGHRGVDLTAEAGATVHAAGQGRVSFAGKVAGTGVVSVLHGELRSTYLPVDPSIERGEIVAPGDIIGTLGRASGHCPGRPCLHWGLLRGRGYLDPLALLGLGEVRLLPVRSPGGRRSGAAAVKRAVRLSDGPGGTRG